MVIKGYFDESGKLADSKHVVFGGFVIRDSYGEVLTEEWNKLILPLGIANLSIRY